MRRSDRQAGALAGAGEPRGYDAPVTISPGLRRRVCATSIVLSLAWIPRAQGAQPEATTPEANLSPEALQPPTANGFKGVDDEAALQACEEM
jgi:hypothetical protein